MPETCAARDDPGRGDQPRGDIAVLALCARSERGGRDGSGLLVVAPSSFDDTRAWVLNFDGFQVAVPRLTGAGQYVLPGAPARGPQSPYANASTDGVGPWYTSAFPLPEAGSVTIAAGLRSGTFSATLSAPGDPPIAKPLTVSGTWSCEIQDGPFPGLPLG